MSDTVIKVENLSKSYTLRHQSGERYTALRYVLTNGVKTIGERLLGRNHGSRNTQHASTAEFWVLNNVSFEIKQGALRGAPNGHPPLGAVGIPSARLRTSIGRNGAGKSTLAATRLSTRLKILSRIPLPTKGRIHIKRRAFGEPGAPGARVVASLLEVALPGDTRPWARLSPRVDRGARLSTGTAILGMSRQAIRRKFEEMISNNRVGA